MISSNMHSPLLNRTITPQNNPNISQISGTPANTEHPEMNVGYGAVPRVVHASNAKEMSIIDHFSNFFTRVVRNVENYFTSSKINSQAENAAVSFFEELKTGSLSDAGTVAIRFNDRMAEIHTEIGRLREPELAKDIKDRVQASTKKVADQYFDRLKNININNYAKFVKEHNKLAAAHDASTPSNNNSISPATQLTSKVFSRIQRNEDIKTIRQTIRTIIPRTWVSAVNGRNGSSYSEATQQLIDQLKNSLKNNLPGKDETAIVSLLDSKRSSFVRQFGVGEPYHPRDTNYQACRNAVNDYCHSNQSDLDLALCELILEHLNWTSYLANTL